MKFHFARQMDIPESEHVAAERVARLCHHLDRVQARLFPCARSFSVERQRRYNPGLHPWETHDHVIEEERKVADTIDHDTA